MHIGMHIGQRSWFHRREYVPRLQKRAPDGRIVVLSQNSRTAWCVGSPGDPAFDPYPLGEFQSMEAARRYADQKWPGGDWQRVDH